MKLHRSLLLFGASALLLMACANEEPVDEVQADESVVEEQVTEEENEKKAQELADELARLEEELAKLEEEQAEEQQAEEEIAKLGSRSNPTPFESTLVLSGTFTDRDASYEEFDADFDITVIDTIRGDEAWDIIINENQFNDPAPEGKEYIINRVRLELYNATSDDLKSSFRYSDFDYISSSGASYSSSFVVLPDELRVELYNNGIGEGNVVGLVDIDDNPLLRFENSFFFETE